MDILVILIASPLAIAMIYTLTRDTRAMFRAPKGRKIEAYYTSAKGYNPLTGESGRVLK